MTKWVKISCVLICVIGTLLCSVGYAALSGTLTITGKVELQPPDYDVVVITKVEIVDGTASTKPSSIIPTNVKSTITGTAGNQVVYKITAYNYSDNVTYAYAGDDSLSEAISNGAVSVEAYAANEDGTRSEESLVGTSVEPGKEVTFYAVYTVAEGQSVSEAELVVNYKFAVPLDSLGEAAMSGATASFLDILNNHYGDLSSLLGKMDRGFTGNVVPEGGSGGGINNIIQWLKERGLFQKVSGEGTAAQSLFGEGFTLEYIDENGETQEREMTTLIQQANIDGRSGDEMILYLTPFNFKGTQITSPNVRVPVYAAVFTCTSYNSSEPTGTWFQLGDIYEGSASAAVWIKINFIIPDLSELGNPSNYYHADCFDYNSWKSGTVTTNENGTVQSYTDSSHTETRFTSDGEALQYLISKDTGIQTIIQTKLQAEAGAVTLQTPAQNAMWTELNDLIDKAEKRMTDISNDKYAIALDDERVTALQSALGIARIIKAYGAVDVTLAETITCIRQLSGAIAPFPEIPTE